MEWNIDEKDGTGMTPLNNAAAEGSYQNVEDLLSRDADPNIGDVNGTTPLMNAACEPSEEMVVLLLQYGANPELADNFGDSAIDYARGVLEWDESAREEVERVIAVLKKHINAR